MNCWRVHDPQFFQRVTGEHHDTEIRILSCCGNADQSVGVSKWFSANQCNSFDSRASTLQNLINEVADADFSATFESQHFRIAALRATQGAALDPDGKPLPRSFGFGRTNNVGDSKMSRQRLRLLDFSSCEAIVTFTKAGHNSSLKHHSVPCSTNEAFRRQSRYCFHHAGYAAF